MKKLTEIKKELDSTNTRIAELETELTKQTAIFENTQRSFIAGKADIDALHAEQSKLTLLAQAIESLEVSKSELQTAFNEVTATETRTALIESARTTAIEAETLFNESLELRRELDDAIGELAEKFTDSLFSFHAKKREYMKLRGQFEPTTKTPGLSDDAVLLLERNYINFPPVRFGLSIQSAYQTVATEREKQESAKSRAA